MISELLSAALSAALSSLPPFVCTDKPLAHQFFVGHESSYRVYLYDNWLIRKQVTRVGDIRSLHGVRDAILVKGYGWAEVVGHHHTLWTYVTENSGNEVREFES